MLIYLNFSEEGDDGQYHPDDSGQWNGEAGNDGQGGGDSQGDGQGEKPDFKCPGEGYYADPNSRHKFFRCDLGGDAYWMDCPPDLVWKDELTLCDWPEK